MTVVDIVYVELIAKKNFSSHDFINFSVRIMLRQSCELCLGSFS